MSDTAIIIIPILLGLGAGFVGWRTVHRRVYKAFWIVMGLVLLVSAGLYAEAVSAPGWDGIAYLIMLVMGSLPVTVAMLVGGAVGLVTQRRLALPS